MESWEHRPVEIANLLNPAFCGELLYYSISSYRATSQKNFPFSLSFLVLPIVLHSSTRNSMPPQKGLHVWLQEKPEIKIEFAKRVKNMTPITQEAIIFLMQNHYLNVDNYGDLYLTRSLASRKIPQENQEIKECIKKSVYLGKKLASAGSDSVIFAMWGIKP